jgi:hypothetical protein
MADYRRPDAVGLGVSDGYLTAIGGVCVAFAQADVIVNSLLSALIPINDFKGQHLVGGIVDVRDKIDLAKHFARLRISDNSKFEVVETFLNRLMDYGAERNRVVHDFWVTEKEGTRARTAFKPSLKKHQSGEAKELLTMSAVSMTPDDVLKIRDAINSLVSGLADILVFYHSESGGGQTPWHDISHKLPPKPAPQRAYS